jgi:hypothetical protein
LIVADLHNPFFDLEAYEAKLKDTDNSVFDLLYMGIEEPGIRS